MKITNKERMSQLGSAITSNVSVLSTILQRNHPDILGEKPFRTNPNKTIDNLLKDILSITETICGEGEEAKYYYADLNLGYTEDTFPVEHR